LHIALKTLTGCTLDVEKSYRPMSSAKLLSAKYCELIYFGPDVIVCELPSPSEDALVKLLRKATNCRRRLGAAYITMQDPHLEKHATAKGAVKNIT